MVVIARTDPHAAHQDVYDAHPDWIAVDADGQKRPPSGHAGAVDHLRSRSLQLRVHDRGHQEIVSLYKVDGVFSNRWAGSGMCYCEHCRQNFKAASGLDLPRTQQPAGSRAPRLHRVAAAAPVRSLAAVGCRDPQDQSRRALHPQHRRRGPERSRYEDASANWRPSSSPTARRAAA